MKTKDFLIMAIEAALMVGALLAIGFLASLEPAEPTTTCKICHREGGAL